MPEVEIDITRSCHTQEYMADPTKFGDHEFRLESISNTKDSTKVSNSKSKVDTTNKRRQLRNKK